MADEDTTGTQKKAGSAEDFLQVFKRGVQFTEELLLENERLRMRLVRLEEENRTMANRAVDASSYVELMEKVKILGDERKNLMERFQSAEVESLDFKERYREIEEENNRLANLYIASYQLHSTLDIVEVTGIAFEIIINLVGSMEFALYIREGSKLVPVRAQGHALSALPLVTFGTGTAGKSAEDQSLYVSGSDMTEPNIQEPKICIPLVVEGDLLGQIVIFSFLSHKTCITELDRELFNLLGRHAVALFAARLSAGSKDISHNASDYLKLLNT